MSCKFTKLRETKYLYETDFKNHINVSDVLSNPRVVVERGGERRLIDFEWYPDAPWEDVSGQFAITGEAITGTKVQFELGAAATATDQAVGTYRVTVLADVTGGRIVGSRHWLVIK